MEPLNNAKFSFIENFLTSISQKSHTVKQLAERILNSSLFWAVAGIATLTITTAVIMTASGGALIPFAIVSYALGVGMLTPALNQYNRFIHETTLISTIFNHIYLRAPWYHEIIPGQLTLGAMPLVNYNHIQELTLKKITFVLTALKPYEWNQSNLFGLPTKSEDWLKVNIDHAIIEAADFSPVSQDSIKEGVRLLKQAIQEKKGHVYVHCKAGRGRSATIVICYLLQYGEMHNLPKFTSFEEAINYVKSKRNQISINKKQKEAIKTFYESLAFTQI